MRFLNREGELRALERWWRQPGARLGLVWGRRRVGKTALLHAFAADRAVIFHTAGGRPLTEELRILSRVAHPVVGRPTRSLIDRPYATWTQALEELAEAAAHRRILLVLDEFPELLTSAPELPDVLRAVWDNARAHTNLRILVCGSATRVMRSMTEARAALYGRFDLTLLVHPMEPHEAAMFVPRLSPADQAIVWGLVGGTPLYLDWWDENRSIRSNLERLVCTPGGRLLSEGQLLLATEGEKGELDRQVLYAIASGHTKHNEIADVIRADPTRTLDRLTELRVVERLIPVTEDPRRTRRRIYRIADNLLAFWLGIVDRYRTEIERGLGPSILGVLVSDLDAHLGPRFEEAFRIHLRRLAAAGRLGEEIVAVGPFWTAAGDPVEIDAVVLAGRQRRPVMLGEAKWTRSVDARRIGAELLRKADALPRRVPDELRVAVCARDEVAHPDDVLAVTARDIFATVIR